MDSRMNCLDRLRRGEARGHVLIVGGGINGIGVYRDLALQGIPALLIDKGDFASGTSAAPSRLIHGGLRYLETGEFALVRESVEERNHLLVNAPHQVRPIPVWVPTFSWAGGAFSAAFRFLKLKRTPGPKGALVVRLGLMFFDRFGEVNRTMPRHRPVPRAEVVARFPNIDKRVAAVVEYYDARISSPERLSVELVGDAERDCPAAMAIPYLALDRQDASGVHLTDSLTGETFTVSPALVVNCAGPWVDLVDHTLGIPDRLIGGTKGSHLVLDRPDIADRLGDTMLYFETSDYRACLAYRLDGGKVLLGTTDLRTDDPEDLRCSDAEISYLFKILEEVLPGSRATVDDIVFTFAGIRPLPRVTTGATGAISRDHSVVAFEPTPERAYPVLSLVGGKWTTYRPCAAQITDAVLGRLGAERRRDTLTVPIGGGAGFAPEGPARAAAIAALHAPTPEAGRALYLRYGSAAHDLAATLDTAGWTPINGLTDYYRGEIAWIIREERVSRLEDIILRRTLIALDGASAPATLRDIAGIAAGELGWSAEQTEEEVTRTLALLSTRYRASNGDGGAGETGIHAARNRA